MSKPIIILKAFLTYIALRFGIRPNRHAVWRLDLFVFCIRNKMKIIYECEKFFKIKTLEKFPKIYTIRHYPSSDFSVFKTVRIEEQYDFKEDIFNGKAVKYIIDAGSNVGYSTMYFKEKYQSSWIIAIEPSLDNIKVFETNIIDNNLKNVTIENKGLWFKETDLYLDLGFRDGREHSIRTLPTYSSDKTVIKTTTLALLLEKYNWNNIDILKIDIEGAEKYIFADEDVEKVLQKTKLLAIEIHDELKCREDIMQKINKYFNTIYQNGELTIAYNK